MTIDRRSGAPSAFTWLLGLTLGATCAAMTTACSAGSGSTGPGGWGQSGGGPLGGGSNGESSGSGNDASTSPAGNHGGGDAAAASEGGGGRSDAGAPSGDSAMDAAGDGASTGDAQGDGAAPAASFTLIDTAITGIIDGSPVTGFDPIAEGATVNLAQVGTALSIRANTVPALVGSVAFALDATYTHTENATPYMLCADDGKGTITSCAAVLTVGKHTLTATPYSLPGLGGIAGVPILLDFTIDDIADAGIADAAGQ